MKSEPNPYEPPSDAPTDESGQTQPNSINFPGGLLTPLGIGLGGAALEVMLIRASDHLPRRFDAIILLLMPLVWCSSFASVAYLLPGTAAQRSKRTVIGFLVGFPALVLYVPVCGLVSVATGSDVIYNNSPLSMTLGTLVAFVSVLFSFALLVRHLVRSAHRKQ